jgi:uncharacterized membrane protein YccC
MTGMLRRAASGGKAIGEALYRDLLDVRWSGQRATTCFVTAISGTVATTLAMALHLDDIWWATISGFMATQATTPASLRKGVLRIVGTVAGAGAVVLLSPLLVDDPVLVTLLIFVASTFGILGLLVSAHGYAWMLAAITVDMVLMNLLSDPHSTLEVAASRTAEVAVGTGAAMLVSVLAALEETEPPADTHPGWRHLLDAQWPATEYAIRAAIAVVTVPWVWAWLHVPSDAQIAITITAVMALPALGTDPQADQQDDLGTQCLSHHWLLPGRRCWLAVPRHFDRRFPAMDADPVRRRLDHSPYPGVRARNQLHRHPSRGGFHFDAGARAGATG